MNKIKTAQDVLVNPGGYYSAGFNQRIFGLECPEITPSYGSSPQYHGWNHAEQMVQAGLLFYVHNFHMVECKTGYAFPYGSTWVCNTCQKEQLDRPWWSIRVQKDGNEWFCTGLDFVDLQESQNFAFGQTREAAIEAYGCLFNS